MNTLFIFGAKYLFILSPLLALMWWHKLPVFKKKTAVKFALFSLPLTLIIGKILNLLVVSPRPFVVDNFTPLIQHAADNGFPSDHTLLVASIAAVVTFIDIKKSPWFWLIAIGVAVSRVAVGVHHPIDVTGSAAIAAVSAYIVHYGLQWYTKNNGNK